METIQIGRHFIGKQEPLAFICGPCVIETEDQTLYIAERLKNLFSNKHSSLIFKASYDKANRSSIQSFRGPGLEEGLRILEKVQRELELPVLTDVHSPEEAKIVGNVLDVIQIPAFLSRQTDLIAAAGNSSATVNVKKGQFMSPWEMKNVVDKLLSCNKRSILLTDRGTSFGYHNLVSDFRAIPILQSFGFPVCFDASHSIQLPGGLGNSSGGTREFIPTLARAAVAAGANAIFIETHPDPIHAKSDAASVFPLDFLSHLVEQLEKIYETIQCFDPDLFIPVS